MDIKPLISEWFEIDPQEINRIELEDIKLSYEAETNLNAIIARMIEQARPLSTTAGELLAQIDELIDCRGFWLESSRELLVYIQVLNQIKAVLVPPRYWKVRHLTPLH